MRRDRRSPSAHERSGKGLVVKKDPGVTAEDIIKFCGTQLDPYKIPNRLEFRTTLPKDQCRKDSWPRIARRKEGSRLRPRAMTEFDPSHDGDVVSRGRTKCSKTLAIAGETKDDH